MGDGSVRGGPPAIGGFSIGRRHAGLWRSVVAAASDIRLTLQPHLERRHTATGTCRHYIAFTHRPEQSGTIELVLCPLFFDQGSQHVRELTLLHEMVHVVAGPDECRAMAYAARIELLAYGQFTANHVYWSASGCRNSQFSMPH